MNGKSWRKKNNFRLLTVRVNNVPYLVLCILLAGLTYSCQNRPKEVLGRKQMEQLMFDVYIAEATMENDYHHFDTPEKKEAYIKKIFEAHKTTQARWDTSLSWYSDHIDLYLKMNDSVKVRLQRAKKEVEELIAQQNKGRETDPALLPLSYLPSHYSFFTPDTKRGFRFQLDTAEIASRITNDDFVFRFSVIGIPSGFTTSFSSLFSLVYADTTIYHFQNINENREYLFSGSKYIDGDTISQILGFVHLHDSAFVLPPVQIYGIYLGDKPSSISVSDTVKTDGSGLENMNLTPDSVDLQSDQNAMLLKKDSLSKTQ